MFKEKNMSTLKNIAGEAGVSIMTVSNVINGNHSKVSAKTIQKVNEIIRKYNYSPNLNARSLLKKSSRLILKILTLADCSENLNLPSAWPGILP